uniref:MFS transporter n=1 Tax=Parastrongyloides trichosuri TaxID=131310 RepID=A0A0N4ZIZ5_PARTI
MQTRESLVFVALTAACVVIGLSLAILAPRENARAFMTLTLLIATPLGWATIRAQREATVDFSSVPAEERKAFLVQNSFWLLAYLAGLEASGWCALVGPPFGSRTAFGLAALVVCALGWGMMLKTSFEHERPLPGRVRQPGLRRDERWRGGRGALAHHLGHGRLEPVVVVDHHIPTQLATRHVVVAKADDDAGHARILGRLGVGGAVADHDAARGIAAGLLHRLMDMGAAGLAGRDRIRSGDEGEVPGQVQRLDQGHRQVGPWPHARPDAGPRTWARAATHTAPASGSACRSDRAPSPPGSRPGRRRWSSLPDRVQCSCRLPARADPGNGLDRAGRQAAGSIHDRTTSSRRHHPCRRPGHADEVAAAQGAAPGGPTRHAGPRHRRRRGPGLRTYRRRRRQPFARGPRPCRAPSGRGLHRRSGPAARHRPRCPRRRGRAGRLHRPCGRDLWRRASVEGRRYRAGPRSRRLWPSDPARRRPSGHHRGQGGFGRGSGHHRLQLRRHGRPGRPAVRPAGRGEERQRQGRILPDRRGRAGPQARRPDPRRLRRRGLCHGRQRSVRTGPGRGPVPVDPTRTLPGRGRDHVGPRHRPFQLGHPDRRRHALIEPFPCGRRQGRRQGRGRPLRPPAPRYRAGRRRARGQLRRDQEGPHGRGRQGQPSGLPRRRPCGGQGQHRRGHDLLQLRRLLQTPHHGGRGGLRRLELLAGRPRHHRRGRHGRLRLGGDQGRRARRSGPRPQRNERPAEEERRRSRRRLCRGRHGGRSGHRLHRRLVRESPGGARAGRPALRPDVRAHRRSGARAGPDPVDAGGHPPHRSDRRRRRRDRPGPGPHQGRRRGPAAREAGVGGVGTLHLHRRRGQGGARSGDLPPADRGRRLWSQDHRQPHRRRPGRPRHPHARPRPSGRARSESGQIGLVPFGEARDAVRLIEDVEDRRIAAGVRVWIDLGEGDHGDIVRQLLGLHVGHLMGVHDDDGSENIVDDLRAQA